MAEKKIGKFLSPLKWIAVIIVAILLFGGGFALGMNWATKDAPKLTQATVEAQIRKISDMATAELQYNGLVHYEVGDIPLITKKAFTMLYEANARAGVDLSQATVTVTSNKVEVILPQATVQSISIDSDSLAFYDKQFALFNWQNREDTAEALKAAEEDVRTKIDSSALLERANEQALEAVQTLLGPVVEAYPGYKLDVRLAS